MEFNIQKGYKHTSMRVVQKEDTASIYGSGLAEVFSTPAMVALMEKTCFELAGKFLPASHSTVGSELNIRHVKACPVGETIVCEATFTGQEGRKLTFDVNVTGPKGVIGSGTHCRHIIDFKEFSEKAKK